MIRSSFKRPTYERTSAVLTPIPEHLRRAASFAKADQMAEPVEKDKPLRSEAYRRLVASMPCAHCGIHGHSQAAHADFGKGSHIKSDDRTCYPACAPRMGVIGCHALIGMTGSMPRDVRRALEQEYAARTRELIVNAGLWPHGLERWQS